MSTKKAKEVKLSIEEFEKYQAQVLELENIKKQAKLASLKFSKIETISLAFFNLCPNNNYTFDYVVDVVCAITEEHKTILKSYPKTQISKYLKVILSTYESLNLASFNSKSFTLYSEAYQLLTQLELKFELIQDNQ